MDTEKYKRSENDSILEIMVDEPGYKQVRVSRGEKILVVIDIHSPFAEGFQPESQIQLSSLSAGHECYEIWLDGEYFTAYRSK